MKKVVKSKVRKPQGEEIGKNVFARLDGKILVIEIDMTHRGGSSESGKTTRIASTLGNQKVNGAPNAVRLGVNCYERKANGD